MVNLAWAWWRACDGLHSVTGRMRSWAWLIAVRREMSCLVKKR